MKWLSYISIFCLLSLFACKSPQIAQIEGSYISVTSDRGIDSTLYYFLSDYKTKLDTEMDQVVSSTPVDLVKSQPSSNLGNMMVDIVYQYYTDQHQKVDFAVINYGGIRVPSISKGDLTLRDAYQLMPFDNKLVTLNISGKKVLQFAEHIIQLGGWPIAQMDIVLDSNKNIKHIYIGGQELDKEKEYTLATNDYVANGGDYCEFLADIPHVKSNKLFREVIIEYWKKQAQGIQVDPSKRIRYE